MCVEVNDPTELNSYFVKATWLFDGIKIFFLNHLLGKESDLVYEKKGSDFCCCFHLMKVIFFITYPTRLVYLFI